jgi:hypothetical protein
MIEKDDVIKIIPDVLNLMIIIQKDKKRSGRDKKNYVMNSIKKKYKLDDDMEMLLNFLIDIIITAVHKKEFRKSLINFCC